jgi:hypothetical protein
MVSIRIILDLYVHTMWSKGLFFLFWTINLVLRLLFFYGVVLAMRLREYDTVGIAK